MEDIMRILSKGRKVLLFFPFVFIFSAAAPVFSDIIYLKNGETIEGLVKNYNSEQIGIQTKNNLFYMPREEIERIEDKPYFEKEPEVNWAVIGITAGLSVLMFSLAIRGREL